MTPWMFLIALPTYAQEVGAPSAPSAADLPTEMYEEVDTKVSSPQPDGTYAVVRDAYCTAGGSTRLSAYKGADHLEVKVAGAEEWTSVSLVKDGKGSYGDFDFTRSGPCQLRAVGRKAGTYVVTFFMRLPEAPEVAEEAPEVEPDQPPKTAGESQVFGFGVSKLGSSSAQPSEPPEIGEAASSALLAQLKGSWEGHKSGVTLEADTFDLYFDGDGTVSGGGVTTTHFNGLVRQLGDITVFSVIEENRTKPKLYCLADLAVDGETLTAGWVAAEEGVCGPHRNTVTLSRSPE